MVKPVGFFKERGKTKPRMGKTRVSARGNSTHENQARKSLITKSKEAKQLKLDAGDTLNLYMLLDYQVAHLYDAYPRGSKEWKRANIVDLVVEQIEKTDGHDTYGMTFDFTPEQVNAVARVIEDSVRDLETDMWQSDTWQLSYGNMDSSAKAGKRMMEMLGKKYHR